MQIQEFLEALQIALKRLLVDGDFLSSDNSHYQKTIAKQDVETARASGTLTFEFDNEGALTITLKDAGF